MDRKAHFFALHAHAWLGKIYKRLTPAQVALCVAFLDLHKHSSKDVFALAVARWYMDKPKPAKLNEMTELMLCANSALPKGYQGVKSAILETLGGVRRITFEHLRLTLSAIYRIQLGRNDMWAAMDHLVALQLVAHDRKGSVNYFALNQAFEAKNKETNMELLGATIREKREARGITRKDLAAKVNVTHDTIGFIERDRPDVFSEDLITRIGKELKLPVANLLKLRETHNEWARKTRADMKAKKAKGSKKAAPAKTRTVKMVSAEQADTAAEAARLGLTDADLINPPAKARKAKAAAPKATPAPKPVHKRRPKAAAPVAEDSAG